MFPCNKLTDDNNKSLNVSNSNIFIRNLSPQKNKVINNYLLLIYFTQSIFQPSSDDYLDQITICFYHIVLMHFFHVYSIMVISLCLSINAFWCETKYDEVYKRLHLLFTPFLVIFFYTKSCCETGDILWVDIYKEFLSQQNSLFLAFCRPMVSMLVSETDQSSKTIRKLSCFNCLCSH